MICWINTTVFNLVISGYNDALGPFKAKVNMGPVEPLQRKGCITLYVRVKITELQQKFDELESLGLFQRQEDMAISVKYLNMSFLVRKQNGGYRLVTAFTVDGQHSKPKPSLMSDVDSVTSNRPMNTPDSDRLDKRILPNTSSLP